MPGIIKVCVAGFGGCYISRESIGGRNRNNEEDSKTANLADYKDCAAFIKKKNRKHRRRNWFTGKRIMSSFFGIWYLKFRKCPKNSKLMVLEFHE